MCLYSRKILLFCQLEIATRRNPDFQLIGKVQKTCALAKYCCSAGPKLRVGLRQITGNNRNLPSACNNNERRVGLRQRTGKNQNLSSPPATTLSGPAPTQSVAGIQLGGQWCAHQQNGLPGVQTARATNQRDL